MTQSDFLNLVEIIRPFAKERCTKLRNDIITLEKRTAITLHYLKDKGSLRVTANSFGVVKCTTSVTVLEICSILAKTAAPDLTRFSIEKEHVLETARKFLKRFGFPQVIDCMDGIPPF